MSRSTTRPDGTLREPSLGLNDMIWLRRTWTTRKECSNLFCVGRKRKWWLDREVSAIKGIEREDVYRLPTVMKMSLIFAACFACNATSSYASKGCLWDLMKLYCTKFSYLRWLCLQFGGHCCTLLQTRRPYSKKQRQACTCFSVQRPQMTAESSFQPK